MKVRALGNLSGAVGDQEAGSVFEVDDDIGQSLIDRGVVERVDEKEVVKGQSEKPLKE